MSKFESSSELSIEMAEVMNESRNLTRRTFERKPMENWDTISMLSRFIAQICRESQYFSILGNLLVILTILTSRKMRKLDCTPFFVLMALGYLLSAVNEKLLKVFWLDECPLSSVLRDFGLNLAQIMTVVLAIDRFFALCYPIIYWKRNKHLTTLLPCVFGKVQWLLEAAI